MLEVDSLPRRRVVRAVQERIITDNTRYFREKVFGIPYCDDEKAPGPLALFSFIERSVSQDLSQLRSLSSARHLASGTLLFAHEQPVNFPVVHYKEDDGSFSSYLHCGHTFDNNIIQQGLFREIRSICPEDDVREPDVLGHVAYILLAYKHVDNNFSQVMIDSWKDWTGARYIYMYLPEELGLTRIRLYRREAPNSHTMFTYIVIVECTSVDTPDKQIRLLDFARRLRVQKMNGYITVYGLSNK